jgi:citrate lyase subunit beta/citryl-CoA lyase
VIRSYLYVPADNSGMLTKAVSRGSDALIIDLEDAVSVKNKILARENLKTWLARVETTQEIWVRVNADSLKVDCLTADHEKVTGVIVPMATTVILIEVKKYLEKVTRLGALIETAASILDARAIAETEGVTRLQVGMLDLRSELGVSLDSNGSFVDFANNMIVFASAAAGIQKPIGSIIRNFKDLDSLRASTLVLKENGFEGRACIHPNQIAVVNEVFTPTDEEILRAHALLATLAKAGGSVTIDAEGRMIDKAVIVGVQKIADFKES